MDNYWGCNHLIQKSEPPQWSGPGQLRNPSVRGRYRFYIYTGLIATWHPQIDLGLHLSNLINKNIQLMICNFFLISHHNST